MAWPSDGLHRTHPGFALCLVGMISLWGGLGLISLFAPPRLFPREGALQYVNALPRLSWGILCTAIALGMAYGASQVPRKRRLLRNFLAIGFVVGFVRGCLVVAPVLLGAEASLNALPIWTCLIFLHFAALVEPFRNPLTEKTPKEGL